VVVVRGVGQDLLVGELAHHPVIAFCSSVFSVCGEALRAMRLALHGCFSLVEGEYRHELPRDVLERLPPSGLL